MVPQQLSSIIRWASNPKNIMASGFTSYDQVFYLFKSHGAKLSNKWGFSFIKDPVFPTSLFSGVFLFDTHGPGESITDGPIYEPVWSADAICRTIAGYPYGEGEVISSCLEYLNRLQVSVEPSPAKLQGVNRSTLGSFLMNHNA